MALLSLPIIGDPTQAITQVQNRLDGVFGRRSVALEYVRDPVTGVVTELLVNLSDDLPPEDVAAFRRGLGFIDGRGGLAIDPPAGSGGGVSAAVVENFDGQFGATGLPVGFRSAGSVSFGGGAASGPNTIHTDGGTGLAHDLSTTDISADLPIQPGSLTLTATIGATTETATDDGAGAFPTSTLLPSGGTINYVTGEMTGTTAAIDASTDIDETHTVNAALSPARAAILASGAAAGNATLVQDLSKGVAAPLASLLWSFNVQFSTDFGLNNNSVTGAQTLTLEARLLGGLATGQNIVLRWTASSDNTTPPAAWGTPAFVGVVPTESPTAALAVDIDATYHEITIRRIGPRVLGVAYDGVEETFTFAADLVVPKAVVLNHNWGAALDRSFNVDDWSLSYTLPALPPLA